MIDDLEWNGKDWVLAGCGSLWREGLIVPENSRDMVQDAVERRLVNEIDDGRGNLLRLETIEVRLHTTLC